MFANQQQKEISSLVFDLKVFGTNLRLISHFLTQEVICWLESSKVCTSNDSITIFSLDYGEDLVQRVLESTAPSLEPCILMIDLQPYTCNS